jgi:hypothetical protein
MALATGFLAGLVKAIIAVVLINKKKMVAGLNSSFIIDSLFQDAKPLAITQAFGVKTNWF